MISDKTGLKVLPLLLLMISQCALLQAADRYQVGDTLYTWAPSGLNVRAEASASSSKVGKLQPGDRVIILARTEIPFNLTVIAPPKALEDEYLEDYGTSPYQLQGHWVKVAGQGFSGYVIDMYLLAWQPPAPKTSFHTYFEKLQGEPILMDTSWQHDASGNRNLDIYSYRGESSEGIVFSGSSGEGAVDDALSIPSLTLEEGFVFCNFFMPLEDGLRVKRGLKPLELYRHNEREISITEDELCYFAIAVASGILRIEWGCSC